MAHSYQLPAVAAWRATVFRIRVRKSRYGPLIFEYVQMNLNIYMQDELLEVDRAGTGNLP